MRLVTLFSLLVVTAACSSSSSGSVSPKDAGTDSGGAAGAAGTGGSAGTATGGAGGASDAGAGGNCTAPPKTALLLHTTLDDDLSITKPAFGSPGTPQGAPTYENGFCNMGMRPLDGASHAQFPELDVIDYAKGRVEFRFKPNFQWNIAEERYILRGGEGSAVRFRVIKFDGTTLEVRFEKAADNFYRVNFPTSGFPTAGNWIHFAISWDFAPSTPVIELSVDGSPVVGNPSQGSAFDGPPTGNQNGVFQIGSRAGKKTEGVIDEVRVFNKPTP